MALFDGAAFDPLTASGILGGRYPAGQFVNNNGSLIGDLIQRALAGYNRGVGQQQFGGQYGYNPRYPYDQQQLPSSVSDLLMSAMQPNSQAPQAQPPQPQVAPQAAPVDLSAKSAPQDNGGYDMLSPTPLGPLGQPAPQQAATAAQPAQYAPHQAPQQQIPGFDPQSLVTVNPLQASISPGWAQLRIAQQQQAMSMGMLQAQLKSLMQQPGMTLPKAMALINNQKVQEQTYGNATSPGSLELPGGLKVPFLQQGGGQPTLATGGSSLPDLVQMGQNVLRSNSAAEAEGKVQGTNAAGLPQALAQADQAIKLIDDISKDPNLGLAVGFPTGHIPAIGGQQANVIAKIDQLRGQTFLQAWQALKGAGARITNTESLKATDAIGRLQRAQNVQGFQSALNDLRDVIVGVRTRAGVAAGGAPTPPPASIANAPRVTQSGVRWSIGGQ